MVLRIRNLLDFLNSIPSEQDCINYLEEAIWKGKPPVSPFDPVSKVYKCAGNKWKCKNTGKYFTARSLTVFRNSNLSLKKCFLALYSLISRKKGISSLQLVEEIGITQKSAWFMEHRLRYGLQSSIFKTMLKGVFEMDETFIGGKNKNRHWNKKIPRCQGRNYTDKIPVWGTIDKISGILITEVVPNTQQETLEPIIRKHIKEGSTINTDEWKAYNDLHKWYDHHKVNHSIKQYVNGKVSTNSIESVWAVVKRTVYGTYHSISKKHSQKYTNEITFRFNTRKLSGQERFDLAFSSMVGKSLTYGELISC